VHRALADLAGDRHDVVGRHALAGEADRAVHEGLGHGPAGIGLEGERLEDPALAETVEEAGEIRSLRRREGLVEAVRSLEHGDGPGEAGLGQERGTDAGLRRRTRVEALRRAAVGEVFDDARGQAARDAERAGDGLLVETERGTDRRGGSGRAEDGGRVEACLVGRLRAPRD
jgi:hypothetical protein